MRAAPHIPRQIKIDRIGEANSYLRRGRQRIAVTPLRITLGTHRAVGLRHRVGDGGRARGLYPKAGVRRKLMGCGGTPRDDGKYAQPSESTGDRGATWRIRRRADAGRSATQRALRSEHRDHRDDTPRDFDSEGGTTSVALERVRKLLKIDGIDGCRCAKECVIP